jgi:hypothetical protein
VGVCTSIQDYAVAYRTACKTSFLQLIDKLSLNVALEIVYLHIRIGLAQLLKIVIKRLASIDARLALS